MFFNVTVIFLEVNPNSAVSGKISVLKKILTVYYNVLCQILSDKPLNEQDNGHKIDKRYLGKGVK